MLIKVNSKPQDIYTDDSVTRNQSGWRFTVKQGKKTKYADSGI